MKKILFVIFIGLLVLTGCTKKEEPKANYTVEELRDVFTYHGFEYSKEFKMMMGSGDFESYSLIAKHGDEIANFSLYTPSGVYAHGKNKDEVIEFIGVFQGDDHCVFNLKDEKFSSEVCGDVAKSIVESVKEELKLFMDTLGLNELDLHNISTKEFYNYE